MSKLNDFITAKDIVDMLKDYHKTVSVVDFAYAAIAADDKEEEIERIISLLETGLEPD